MKPANKGKTNFWKNFLKEAKFDAPPVLVEEEVDYMIADLNAKLKAKDLNLKHTWKR